MTKSFVKNAFLVGSGIAIATSTAIFAMPANTGTSIQANLVNLAQYLSELRITSDGTPNGDEVLSINGSGYFGQNRMSALNENIYAIMNGPEGMGPNTEAVGFGAFSGESSSNLVGIVNMFGFNQSLMSYSDDALGIDNYVTAYPQGIILAASGSAGQHGLSITNDGFNAYLNGSPLMTIDNSGNFTNYRGGSQLVNTDSRQGSYPFVGAGLFSGDIKAIAGVLADSIPALAYQNNSGAGSSSYFMAQPDRAMLGFNSDLSNQTDTVNEVQVLDYGVVFRFPQASYTFPMNIGTSGQVLATDGVSQLSWVDAGGTTATESSITDKISLSSTQISSLNSFPVELIPSPGVGKYIKILGIDGKLNFGTTPYSSTSLVVYMSDDGMGNPYSLYELGGGMVPFLGASENVLMSFGAMNGGASPLKIDENTSVMVKAVMFDPSGGDSTVDIYVTYKIIDL